MDTLLKAVICGVDREVELVVTRHPALVKFIRERGYVAPSVPVLRHVSPGEVCGKVVMGVLPIRVAEYAAAIFEIPLYIPPHRRAVELDLDEIKKHAGEPRLYVVSRHAHNTSGGGG